MSGGVGTRRRLTGVSAEPLPAVGRSPRRRTRVLLRLDYTDAAGNPAELELLVPRPEMGLELIVAVRRAYTGGAAE